MITFRVRGRTVSVLYMPPDAAAANARLGVVLDRRRALEAAQVVALEAEAGQRRWQVHLPAELYDGRPHHIGLEAKSNGQLVEAAAFQFSGAPQLLAAARVGAAAAEEPKRAEPAPRQAEAPPRDGRERLTDFLRNEFSADTAERVRGYFAIVDALRPEAEPAQRRQHLDEFSARLRLLSKAADDGRSIDASIIVPVFNCIGYTLA